jgi:hypothetical protein
MTSKGLEEMFEGDSTDTCTGKFPLMLIRGPAEGLACEDLGAYFYNTYFCMTFTPSCIGKGQCPGIPCMIGN